MRGIVLPNMQLDPSVVDPQQLGKMMWLGSCIFSTTRTPLEIWMTCCSGQIWTIGEQGGDGLWFSPNWEKNISNGCLTISSQKNSSWRATDILCFLYQVFGEFSLKHPFESCDSSGGDKLYPRRRTIPLMYTILEVIECTTHLKCSENGKFPSVWTKTPSPLTNSMLDMTRVTNSGWRWTYK